MSFWHSFFVVCVKIVGKEVIYGICFYLCPRSLVMEYSEEQFVTGINRKEREMFHELYRRFYLSLVRFAMKYLQKEEVAEDIVQDLFLSVWERRESFLSYDRLRNFLYISVRNTCLDILKHQTVEQKYARYCVEHEAEAEAETEEILGEEVMRLLFQIIDDLPDRCREVFLLYMDGKKNEEIAGMLQLALDTVKNQKKKAMRILRERLGNLYGVVVNWGII